MHSELVCRVVSRVLEEGVDTALCKIGNYRSDSFATISPQVGSLDLHKCFMSDFLASSRKRLPLQSGFIPMPQQLRLIDSEVR